MAGPTAEELFALLLVRAAEFTGAAMEHLVDEDDDVHLTDSPFAVFGRIPLHRRTVPDLPLTLVAIPLLEVPASSEAEATVRETLGDAKVVYRLDGRLHLFTEHGASAMQSAERFRATVEGTVALCRKVAAAVQAAHGGLTPEQFRRLRG